MAVFDFTVKITRFGAPERARPLVRAVAETMDRLGVDHLLADLNRDGEAAWSDAFLTEPIVISGSGPLLGAFEEQIVTAARELLPDAEVSVDWFGHDPARAAVAAVNREIERVARTFGGLARGQVPARVRLAVLNTDAYLARFGYLHAADERRRPAELTLNALHHALRDVGACLGIDWRSAAVVAADDLGELRVLPVTSDGWSSVTAGRDQPSLVDQMGVLDLDRWMTADEAEFATAEPVDPRLTAQSDDHLHATLFDAIRDALCVVPEDVVVVDGRSTLDHPLSDAPDWLGELAVCGPSGRGPFAIACEPIEG